MKPPTLSEYINSAGKISFRFSNEVTLLYKDKNDELYEQPLSDLVEAGTLIDPDSGEDLLVIGILCR